jgi:hypothetical protein
VSIALTAWSVNQFYELKKAPVMGAFFIWRYCASEIEQLVFEYAIINTHKIIMGIVVGDRVLVKTRGLNA